MAAKPLAGIRVIDLTRVLAGPWASQLLADLGAEVIKVERPRRGDDSRGYGPPFLKSRDGDNLAATTMFLAANRGKKSITIDIAKADGRAILKQLVAGADVLIENYKVGDLARHGLDYESLRPLNPRLVYCSVTGFGLTGPYKNRPGYDPIVQAMCGMMSVTGHPLNQPGGGPMKAGPSIVDLFTGLYAAIAIQGALRARDRDGEGQQVDVSLLDCGVAMMAQQAMQFLLTGVPPTHLGTQANGGAPGGGFHCSDGDIMIAPGNDEGYVRLVTAIGHPELATDPRFDSNGQRLKHRQLINDILNGIFADWTVARLAEALTAANVPASPILDLGQVVAHPQVQARGMVRQVPHPEAGAVALVGNPIRFSRTPLGDAPPPPALGQHTDAVLRSLGIPAEEIERLRQAAIV